MKKIFALLVLVMLAGCCRCGSVDPCFDTIEVCDTTWIVGNMPHACPRGEECPPDEFEIICRLDTIW